MERIKKKIRNVKCTILNICDKIKHIKENIDFFKALWEKQQTKDAFALCRKRLWKLFLKIRPRRIEGWIRVGTDDPAMTGQLLGIIAVFYGFYPEKLQIIPEFEEQIFETEVRIRGKVRLIHLLVAAVMLMKDKNVRYVYKKLQSKED